jgi:hypothetical protein
MTNLYKVISSLYAKKETNSLRKVMLSKGLVQLSIGIQHVHWGLHLPSGTSCF